MHTTWQGQDSYVPPLLGLLNDLLSDTKKWGKKAPHHPNTMSYERVGNQRAALICTMSNIVLVRKTRGTKRPFNEARFLIGCMKLLSHPGRNRVRIKGFTTENIHIQHAIARPGMQTTMCASTDHKARMARIFGIMHLVNIGQEDQTHRRHMQLIQQGRQDSAQMSLIS